MPRVACASDRRSGFGFPEQFSSGCSRETGGRARLLCLWPQSRVSGTPSRSVVPTPVAGRSLVTGRVLEVAGLNAQYMLYAVTDAEDYAGGFCLLRWDLLNGPRLLEVAEEWMAANRRENVNQNGSSSFVGILRPVLFHAGAVVASSHPVARIA